MSPALAKGSAPTAEWLCFVLGSLPGALLAVAGSTGLLSERVALALFAVSFVGLNLAHNAATWSRVYLDRRGLEGALGERVLIPAALVIGALAVEAVGGAVLLLGAQFYLSMHHALMQNYGLLRVGQRRAGRTHAGLSLRVDQAACVLLPLAALMYRARAVCHEYSGAALLAPPAWLIAAAAAAGAAAIVAFVLRELAARGRGEPSDAVGLGLVIGTSALWSALIVAIPHPALPLYAFASGHYIQYLYFVWSFERRLPGLSVLPERLRARVAPPARFGYLVGLVALGGGVTVLLTLVAAGLREGAAILALRPTGALPIPPWAAAMIGVNLSHYWLDHRIWRRPALAAAEAVA